MENKPKKILKDLSQLSEEEKLNLFQVEELEGRLETAWNDVCPKTDEGCNSGCDEGCTNDGCDAEEQSV